MPAHYVQKFLDHAKLSTTSRYLQIEQQGMHAALQATEKTQKTAERRAARGKAVAKVPAAIDQPTSGRIIKSVQ